MHIPFEAAQILTYVVMVLTIIFLLYLANRHGGSMMHGLKGHNNRWDAPEIMIAFFLPIGIIMLVVDIFLGLHPSAEAWLFVGSGLGIGSGSRAYVERGHQKHKKEEEIKTSDEG